MSSPGQRCETAVCTEVLSEEITVTIIHDTDESREHDIADQVKTVLGPVLKQLDLPRIHVMAEGHRVLLHGDVSRESDAEIIEDTILGLSDVDAVESHLHVGLLPSDTRPSQGVMPPSEMYLALMAAAADADLADPGEARAGIRGTLSAILEQIPPDERRHLFAHFPYDVRPLAAARRELGTPRRHWRRPKSLEIDASLRGGMTLETAIALLPKVIVVLRVFVPEEDQDVQATLTRHLRQFWIDQLPEELQ